MHEVNTVTSKGWDGWPEYLCVQVDLMYSICALVSFGMLIIGHACRTPLRCTVKVAA